VAVDEAAPLAPAPLAPAPLAPDPILDAPVSQAAPVARQPLTAWPCLGCGAQVPLADNACGDCGRAFLPAEGRPSLALPGVGDITRLDRGQKIMFVVVGASVLTALLVALTFLAGAIL
jgi:hypothetical protein